MSNFELIRFFSTEELVNQVAQNWVDAVKENPNMSVALSGGRVAKTFLAKAAELAIAGKVPFGQVQFFWGDERCVPPDHDDSNFKLAKDALLASLNIPAENIHRLRGEDDGAAASAIAIEDLKKTLTADGSGVPVLDIVFLGMGEDAHVASLFPEEDEAARNLPDFFRPVTATKPPPQRISIGYNVIGAAKEVWVLASGTAKADALKASLMEDANTPFARVLRSRTHTSIYTDIE
jgi:6-phosphogluconolactonase